MQTSHNIAAQVSPFKENVYVLIVTDSPLTQKYVASILREIIDLGNTQLHDNSENALRHIRNTPSQHCSFIFYENSVNPDDHQSFIDLVRAERDTVNTPVVILGSQPPAGYKTEDARIQLTTFLQRPFVPSQLISLLFELFQEKDRRLAKRIDTGGLPCIVDMGYYATEPYKAQMLNISYTGCLLQTQHEFDDCGNLDDIGSVSFSSSVGKIKLSGKIVRLEQGEYHQLGFQFQNNEEEDLVKLGKLISALSRNT